MLLFLLRKKILLFLQPQCFYEILAPKTPRKNFLGFSLLKIQNKKTFGLRHRSFLFLFSPFFVSFFSFLPIIENIAARGSTFKPPDFYFFLLFVLLCFCTEFFSGKKQKKACSRKKKPIEEKLYVKKTVFFSP